MGHINYNPSVLTLIGDHFKISVVSAITSCVVTLTGRMQGEDGEISDFRHDVVITATGAASVVYPVPGGFWLMSAMASISSGTVNPGEILVKVELMRGDNTSAVPYHLVLFGSPDSFLSVGMSPGSDAVRPTSPVSYISALASDPAPGDPLTITVPASERWILYSLFTEYAAAIAVASRLPYLELANLNGAYTQVPLPAVITASQTRSIGWTAGARNSVALGIRIHAALNEGFVIEGGGTVAIYVDNIQSGDQIIGSYYTYRNIA